MSEPIASFLDGTATPPVFPAYLSPIWARATQRDWSLIVLLS